MGIKLERGKNLKTGHTCNMLYILCSLSRVNRLEKVKEGHVKKSLVPLASIECQIMFRNILIGMVVDIKIPSYSI